MVGMKKLLGLLALALLASAAAAVVLDPGVTYDCGSTDFNLTLSVSVTNLQLYPNQLILNSSGFSVTPSVGSTYATIEYFDPTFVNMTETNSQAATNQHILSGMQPTTSFGVYKDGGLEDTTTSTGDGIIIYSTDSFSGAANYVFKEAVGSFVVSLNSPAAGQEHEYSPTLAVSYVGSASSPTTVQNLTLYDNRTGSWDKRYVNVTLGSGNKGLGGATGLGLGTILWGAYGCDEVSCVWASSNRTYHVNDTAAPTVNVELNQTSIEADLGDCVHGMYNVTDHFPYSTTARIMKGDVVLKYNTSVNGSITFCYTESSGLGVYDLNVTSSDTSGNVGRNNITFEVRDTMAPRVSVALNVTTLEAGRDCVLINAHSSDVLPNAYSLNITNATGAVLASVTSPLSGGLTTFCYLEGGGLGTYTANLSTSDSSGNKNSTTATFTVQHTIGPTTNFVSPDDATTYTAGDNEADLACNATTYVQTKNFTFTFDDGVNVTVAPGTGNSSTLHVTWNSAQYRRYNWTCGAWDVLGDYDDAGQRYIMYVNSSTTLNCTWRSGAANGSVYNYAYTTDGSNVTIQASNLRRYSQIYCTAYPLLGECNYGATNVSSIVFPVSNESLSACNVTAYTPADPLGNITISIFTDPAYSDSNIGPVNWTTTKQVRRYYVFR